MRILTILLLLVCGSSAFAQTIDDQMLYLSKKVTAPDTFKSDFFRDKDLDYSIDSLHSINEYLELVRPHESELSERQYFNIVTRTGAYVGEVLRREAKGKNCHWYQYQTLAPDNEFLSSLGESMSTFAILQCDTGATFPVGKVIKYMDFGSSEDVHFYVIVILRNWNELK